MGTQEVIARTELMGANNYKPLPLVIAAAEGVWVEDLEGRRYMDMLSSYSALNFGHRHPALIKALKDQADKVTLTSRAFHNDQLCRLYEKLAQLTGKNMFLPMNTGAEAVETTMKVARRWAYRTKKVESNKAEIIVCSGNFHGRTLSITSFSSDEEYRADFGPFTPGFVIVPYGDIEALKKAVTPNTAAFMFEPVQGEAGIVIPPPGYLRAAYELCRANNILFVADEIQTGFGRTGKLFACDWDNIVPDVYILGKALGGGVMPISMVAADKSILGVLEPGSHGSTFGGNPLACAVATAAMELVKTENLTQKSFELGQYFVAKLQKITNPIITEVRGRGLFVGMELNTVARPYCEQLMDKGVLCKDTHGNIIRFAPPLTITKEELDWALERIFSCFE